LGQLEIADLVLVAGCFVPVVLAAVLVALGRGRTQNIVANDTVDVSARTAVPAVDVDTLTQRTFVAPLKAEEPQPIIASTVNVPMSRTREILDVYYGSARRAAAGSPSAR
jgi:hypothetical protein